MSTSSASTATDLARWNVQVSSLFDQIEAWVDANHPDWTSHRFSRGELSESPPETTDQILLHVPTTVQSIDLHSILIEPISPSIPDGEGLVDVTILTSLETAMIVRSEDEWWICVPLSGPDAAEQTRLNSKSFTAAIDGLIGKAGL